MIGLGFAFTVAGVVFAAVAIAAALEAGNPRRLANAGFWGLLATSFLIGDRLTDIANGVLVLLLVAVGLWMRAPRAAPTAVNDQPAAPPATVALFAPALAVPAVTLAGTFLLAGLKVHGQPLIDPKQATVVSLALGAVIALALAMLLLRPPLAAPAREGRRLFNQIGTAAVLPQLLAALGGVFALAGVGGAVQRLFASFIALDDRLAVVAAFCLGMAVFTMVMGNAFAAFPVMAAGLGAPLIVGRFGGDAAVMGAIGMLSGFCGTLMTPMAAHNIVPAALLDLKIGAVIRVQAPTAIILLIINIGLMYCLGFHAGR